MATGRVPTTANSPLTTKGDLFTYDTSQARLAVGSNGETLVADSSATTGLRWQGSYEAGKNFVINGDMNIAQRGTSTASVTNSDSYPCVDRWQFRTNSSAVFTVSQESDAPAGFGKSLKALVTTAAAPTASQRTYVRYLFEGQELQSWKKGTAGALPVTLSFWVKSNVTGTYTTTLYDTTNVRMISKSYTISSSATWEYKTITFAGDTTGTITSDNTRRLEFYINLAGGTDFTSGTLATNWESYTAANWMVGQVNVGATLNNYVQITGVQLELGSVATAFSLKSGTLAGELAACQRYYWRMRTDTGSAYGWTNGVGYAFTTSLMLLSVQLPVPMRVAPTSVDYSGMRVINTGDAAVGSLTSIALNSSTELWLNVLITKTSSFTTDKTYWLTKDNNINHYIGASAEL